MKKTYTPPITDHLGAFTAVATLVSASPSAYKWQKDKHNKERYDDEEDWKDNGEIDQGGWDPSQPID